MKRRVIYLFLMAISVLGVNLALDFALLHWYQEFYEAIQQKSIEKFLSQIFFFLVISGSIAFLTSMFSFVSEYLDLELKYLFTTIGARQSSINSSHQNNQKIIDDAALAAEKFSVALPMMIFNTIKAALMFSAIMFWVPTRVEFVFADMEVPYPLAIASIIFVSVQVLISKKYFPLSARVDSIRRKAENALRLKIIASAAPNDLPSRMKRYLETIVLIRRYTASRNFAFSLALGLLSSISYIIPFVMLFSLFFKNEISFGELMKISATFGFFQTSISYVVNHNRELARGVAAYKRIVG
jgi:ABC-type uncharacterized transport system fused permease/ATPase subunit